MTVFRPDTSFPFLAIARKHGVPYCEVLKIAERDEWWDMSSELRIDVQRAKEAEQRRREEVAYPALAQRALDEGDAEIRKLRAANDRLRTALEEIEAKYQAIMNDPPNWVHMTPIELRWAREGWYGASLIARKALAYLP